MKNNGEIPERGFMHYQACSDNISPQTSLPNQNLLPSIKQDLSEQNEEEVLILAVHTSNKCQYKGCTNDISAKRKKYCEKHGARPLKENAMNIDFVKCIYPGCEQEVEKGRKSYCKMHGKKR